MSAISTPSPGPAKVTVPSLLKSRDSGERLVRITAYDHPSARLADEAGVDMILVGDSLGMVGGRLHSKIHRATVTGADLDYAGSISFDRSLIEATGLLEWERVQVVDVSNGARLETCVIPAPAGSGVVQLNGAAAHLVSVGDKVISMGYSQLYEAEARSWKPTVVHVDDANRISDVARCGESGPAAVSLAIEVPARGLARTRGRSRTSRRSRMALALDF